ncbi:MAG TPA: HD-GYP domain-containing protein [Gaiellaceae bacterium]
MTAASPTASAAPLDDDALIEYSRATASEPLARRDWTGWLAAAFVLVALAALALPAHRSLSPVALVVCVVCYALCARVTFEFGTAFAIPTEAVFVAMWFLLPSRVLPIVILGSLLLAQVPDLARRRIAPDRLPLFAVSSWFSVAPALVVFLLAPRQPEWRALPVYALALVAQLATDFAIGFLLARAVFGSSPLEHLRSSIGTLTVDVLLAPLGVLVAFASFDHPLALLLVLPVLVMFATFAKERQHRVDNALELSTAYRGTAMLLGDVIEADDAYTGSHSRDVVDLVVSVADVLGLDAASRRQAEFAALLHDVGKVKVPSEIINKPGPLEDDEWEIMKTHTVLGQQMLEQIGGLLGDVGRIVRSCHERWDGGGYPDGLAGEDIPLAARIVCCCDAWSAMRTDRSYRKALPVEAAVAELRACAGTHFDPRVVDALLRVLG